MDQLIGLLNDLGKTSRTRSLSDGGTQDDDEGSVAIAYYISIYL